MRTNDLFRDLLDNRIPGHETPTMVWVNIMPKIRPRFYWVPNLPDPSAPTIQDLAEAVDLSKFLEAAGLAFDDIAETMRRMGEGSRCYVPDNKKPAPTPPWAGNIATQKRRRKL